jgi:hypothetical protein
MVASTGPRSTSPVSTNFIRSVPLFGIAGAFFLAGVVVFWTDPHYGPGPFTLWALLIALGFVSTIGGVASWLLAAEPSGPPARSAPPARPTSRRIPERGATPEPLARPPRVDFGRPPPTVRERPAPAPYRPTASDFATPPRSEPAPYRPTPSDFAEPAASTEVWDEEGATEEPPFPQATSSGGGSVEDALHDLDGIERDLAPRSRSPPDHSPTG